MGYLSLAEYLIGLIGSMVVLIGKLKAQAKAEGATDEQLAAVDVKLTVAIAAREADQG